jgi:predicted enzyme related to lactoylglutathione lyase
MKFAEVQTFVTDITRAREFYEVTLGLQLKQAHADWLIFALGGIEFVVMSGATRQGDCHEYGRRAGTVLCLETDDIDRDFCRLKQSGVSFFSEVKTVPQGRFVAFKDPDGTPLELIQRN